MLALYLIVKPSLFYEPSWLLPITNTVFVTVVFFIVAYIAMRNYKATGRIQVLLLGCGVLAFGIGGVIAGFVRSVPGAGANLNVTVYNTGALMGAVFHFAAALILLASISPEVGSERKEFWLVFSYVGLTIFMALFAVTSLRSIIPPFFIQGVGPTALRQWVLGSADILFAFSFLIFMGLYLRNGEVFLYWYSLALALTSISLTAFFIESAVGSPIGWAGRFSQYLGGIYFLVAIIKAIRSAQVRRTSFDDVLTASLSPAEEKFRALAEHSPDMIERFDRGMRHIYVNQTGVRLHGRPAGSIIGKTLNEARLPGADSSLLKERIQRVFETAQPMEVERYVSTEKGRRFYQSHCVPEFGVDGTVVNVLVVSRDLTERKQAEEERERLVVRLEETVTEANHIRAQLEAVFQAMQDGLVVFNMEGNAVLVNEAEARIIGFASAEEMKQNVAYFAKIYDLSDLSGQPLPVEHWPVSRIMRGGSLDRLELRGRRKDTGQEWFFSFSGAPVCDAQGKQVLAVTVTRDITKRKQAEMALQKRTLELQQLTDTLETRVEERTAELAKANEALRHLSSKLLSAQEDERKRIAGELHDTVGACLTAIKFKVEHVLEQMGQTAGAAESLKAVIPVIQESVEECRRMQMDLRPSILDDLGLLPAIAWFSRRLQTIYSDIKIEQEMGVEEGEIPTGLKIVVFRVIQEATNNIAKHSKADLIRLFLGKIDGRMELVIQDNGQGFNLEKMKLLEVTKKGLGLTSMRERIELSGGSFGIESVEGKGTIVRGSWPLE